MDEEPGVGLKILGELPDELSLKILSYVPPYLFVLKRCSKLYKDFIEKEFPLCHCNVNLKDVLLGLDDKNKDQVFSFMNWFDSKTSISSSRIDTFFTKKGKLLLLKWYCEKNKCKLEDGWYYDKAIIRNDIKMLRWLKSKEAGGFGFNASLCALAAKKGNLEMLKLLRSGDLGEICPWDIDTCKEAVKNGQLKILKWVRDKKIHKEDICPWGDICTALASEMGELDILLWLRNEKIHDKICPMDVEICLGMTTDSDIRNWLNENMT